ncbi:MAG TPA: VOC family protein [Acidimicrobiales bacterium]|nr:VOC family protein [Acidimicrobiales bacterium]
MPTPAPEFQLTLDCLDPHAQARWWSGLLGYEVHDAHAVVTTLLESGELPLEDVVEVGGRRAFRDAAAASDPVGARPRLYFQRVPEPKSAKNRLHLDVRVRPSDLEAEVERVVALGASFVEFNRQGEHRWAVMRDPEGNEFCLT